jgi:hypothetical protein
LHAARRHGGQTFFFIAPAGTRASVFYFINIHDRRNFGVLYYPLGDAI